MKPLPKWVGWLSMLGSLGALCTSLAGVLPVKYGAAIAGVGVVLSNISHSLPGTGGTAENP
jgi:hypothetical protein